MAILKSFEDTKRTPRFCPVLFTSTRLAFTSSVKKALPTLISLCGAFIAFNSFDKAMISSVGTGYSYNGRQRTIIIVEKF